MNNFSQRNFGVAAHVDSGKTTFTQRLLVYSNRVHKLASIESGETETDHMVQEKERGITITSAATFFDWKDAKLNLIDTPGHVDFSSDVVRALRVLDGAVMLFDVSAGVEPQSESVWRVADEYDLARLVFLNKFDKTGADFKMSIDSIHDRLKANAVPIQLPIGSEDNFKGVIDLVKMIAYIWPDESDGRIFDTLDIPGDLLEEAIEARHHLIEQASEYNEELMELYLEEKDIPEDLLKSAIRTGTLSGEFFPVLVGSAYKNKGIQPAMDAIVDYLPSPADKATVKGLDKEGNEITRKLVDDEFLSALAFKISTDPYVGKLIFTRVYSGILKQGDKVYNPSTNNTERIGRIVILSGNKQEEVKQLAAGEIGALVGIKNVKTGDTLTDADNPIILEEMTFSKPVISLAIEPATKADQEKMSVALGRLSDEDPTFKLHTDQETGQTIISGMGELHLEIIVDRLLREFKVNAQVGKPQVSYRETIKGEAHNVAVKYKKQSGGKGQYGSVKIDLDRTDNIDDSDLEFINKIKGGAIPSEYIPAVENGIKEAMSNGVKKGFPVVGVKVTLTDGDYHDVDSSEMAFKIAGSMAFQEAMRKAKPIVLEPWFSVEVNVPEDYVGPVVGDLTKRRGQVLGQEPRNSFTVIRAIAPLANMFGYATDLRSLSQGRATYTMQFDSYKELPESMENIAS